MKDQYFADVNDFRKYGVLRILAVGHGGPTLLVCWMLTPSDPTGHGGKVAYLNDPKYRAFDPVLFDFLKTCIISKERNVRAIERSGLIPGALYDWDLLEQASRGHYFQELWRMAPPRSLIFPDPDRGIEVKSVRKGTTKSEMYLYWDELEEGYRQGQSMLVFQHRGHRIWDRDLPTLAAELRRRTGAPKVTAFVSADVSFLLASQADHAELFRNRSNEIAGRWRGEIQVRRY